jgi:hypothetical protein
MNTYQNIFLVLLSLMSLYLSFRLLVFFAIEVHRKHDRNISEKTTSNSGNKYVFFSAIIPAREESEVIVNTIKA